MWQDELQGHPTRNEVDNGAVAASEVRGDDDDEVDDDDMDLSD